MAWLFVGVLAGGWLPWGVLSSSVQLRLLCHLSVFPISAFILAGLLFHYSHFTGVECPGVLNVALGVSNLLENVPLD